MAEPLQALGHLQFTQQTLEVYPAVLVIGNGLEALRVVQTLLKQQPVILVDRGGLPDIAGVICCERHEVVAVKGNAGRFTVSLQGPDDRLEFSVGAIVVALATPKLIDPSLRLPIAQGILGLSQFSWEQDWGKRSVAIVLGQGESCGFTSTARALHKALELREKYGTKVDVFFQEMKVAAPDLEGLYQRARTAGVRFNRYREELGVHVNVLGVSITYHDPLLPEAEPVRVLVDLLLAGEVDLPAPDTAELSELLRTDLGPQGFFQADNLQLLPVRSNREGIYFVGSCHNPIHALDIDVEARAVAAKAARFAPGYVSVPQSQGKVDASKCALCLLCYHNCTHGAVEIDCAGETVNIDALACQGCGTCATLCPAKAIEHPHQPPEQVLSQVKRDVVIFSCRNSFVSQDYFGKLTPLTVQLNTVACGCQIDPQQVLQALEGGAEGVLLLTCLPGNCQNEHGHLWAEKRLKGVRDILRLVGISPLRIQSAAVAANDWRRTLQAVAKLVESFRLGIREGEME